MCSTSRLLLAAAVLLFAQPASGGKLESGQLSCFNDEELDRIRLLRYDPRRQKLWHGLFLGAYAVTASNIGKKLKPVVQTMRRVWTKNRSMRNLLNEVRKSRVGKGLALAFGLHCGVFLAHAFLSNVLPEKSPWWKCSLLYRPTKELDKAQAVWATPKNRVCDSELCWLHPNLAISREEEAEVYGLGESVMNVLLPRDSAVFNSTVGKASLGRDFLFNKRKFRLLPEGVAPVIPKTDSLRAHSIPRWSGLSSLAAVLLEREYGLNFVEKKKRQSLISLLAAQFISPLVLWQSFCNALLYLDGFKTRSVRAMSSIAFQESASAVVEHLKHRYADNLELPFMRPKMDSARYLDDSNLVFVFRDYSWTQKKVSELLPGDVISISSGGSNVVPCDLLMVRGGLVLDESLITGEWMPVMKHQLSQDVDPSQALNLETQHKYAFAPAGTVALRHWQGDTKEGPGVKKTPDGGALAFVLRTARDSTQGRLLRLVEAKVKKPEHQLAKDAIKMFSALATLSVCMSVGHLVKTRKSGGTQLQVGVQALRILTQVLPYDLHDTATKNSIFTVEHLRNDGIMVDGASRIPAAAHVDTILFDKTGTLTRANLELYGVLDYNGEGTQSGRSWSQLLSRRSSQQEFPSEPGTGEVAADGPSDKNHGMLVRKSELDSSSNARMVLATCQSVQRIPQSLEMIGDPLDLAAVTGLGWRVNEAGLFMPRSSEGEEWARVHKLFAFHPETARTTAVVEYSKSNGQPEWYVVCKGSPDSMERLLVNKPEWYRAKVKSLERGGYRVLALARKRITREEGIKLSRQANMKQMENKNEESSMSLAQRDAECALRFVGFAAFEEPLHTGTKLALNELKDANIKSYLVTGDGSYTAVKVARESGLISEETRVAILDRIEHINSSARSNPKISLVLSDFETEEIVLDQTMIARKDNETGSNSPNQTAKRETESVVDADTASEAALANYDVICISGGAFKELQRPGTLVSSDGVQTASSQNFYSLLLGSGKVQLFSRMKPRQKQQLVSDLQEKGRKVMMVGDGANDAGALLKADSGLALLPASPSKSARLTPIAQASRAAPFVTREEGIKSVPLIIGHARRAESKLLQRLKIESLGTALEGVDLATLYSEGTKFNERQDQVFRQLYYLLALGVNGNSFQQFVSPPRTIPSTTSPPSLFEKGTFVGIIAQAMVHVSTMMLISAYARKGDRHDKRQILSSSILLSMAEQGLSIALCNYPGHPFQARITENWFLLSGAIALMATVLGGAFGRPASLVKYMQLTPFPLKLRRVLTAAIVLDLVLSFGLSRLAERIFNPGRYAARMAR